MAAERRESSPIEATERRVRSERAYSSVRDQSPAATAGVAAGVWVADISDVQGKIVAAEIAGNNGMADVVGTYANSPSGSLAGFMAEQEWTGQAFVDISVAIIHGNEGGVYGRQSAIHAGVSS